MTLIIAMGLCSRSFLSVQIGFVVLPVFQWSQDNVGESAGMAGTKPETSILGQEEERRMNQEKEGEKKELEKQRKQTICNL